MTSSATARHVLAAVLLIVFVVSLVVNPIPAGTVLLLALPGILAGVLFLLPGSLLDWIGAGLLVFGPQIVASILVRRGTEVTWYAPTVTAVAFCILVYYAGELLKGGRKPASA